MNIEFLKPYDKHIEDVINLGKKNSSTLGMMPKGGFYEHAYNRNIIIAHDNELLYGYLMFRKVKKQNKITIVHLCISKNYRHLGLAQKLLKFLKDEFYNDYYGISISCREDYVEANNLWRNFGFNVLNKTRSRSQDPKYLIKYWYDFNKPDLFNATSYKSKKVHALLDVNVIIDLKNGQKGVSGEEEWQALFSDWLIDFTDFFYAAETLDEFHRDSNQTRIKENVNYLESFAKATHDIEIRKNISCQLERYIQGDNDHDRSDRIQIATCIAAEIPFFITKDEGILRKREQIQADYNLEILSPSEFILRIDEINNPDEYKPVKINEICYITSKKLSASDLDTCISTFFREDIDKKASRFSKSVRFFGSKLNTSRIRIITNSKKNKQLAFFCIEEQQQTHIIHFIRLQRSDFQYTLFMQLISDFIDDAIKLNCKQIMIKDSITDSLYGRILNKRGFEYDSSNKTWQKEIIQEITSRYNIAELFELRNISFDIPNLDKACTNNLLKLEQKFFPLKIYDLQVPCYIIPIKTTWAAKLFDKELSKEYLEDVNPQKFWNIENAYYRSDRGFIEIAPARILWYVSADKYTPRSKCILAISYLDDLFIGTPKEAFKKYDKYGIYGWEDVNSINNSSKSKKNIRALQFSRTEIFKTPISLKQLKGIFYKNNIKSNNFQSPLKITCNTFKEIYQLGQCQNR
ncbi:MAG: GNAT family N-acetyltransferase [Rikenellaceae bacterium]